MPNERLSGKKDFERETFLSGGQSLNRPSYSTAA
jgi:hypothetical protein